MKKNFFESVCQVVNKIPFGKVTSYGAVASYLGSAKSARMVGWALNKSNLVNVPAHRVVNKNGMLTGKFHFGDPTLMQQLLENEGIEIVNHQVKNFDEHFWDPTKELDKLPNKSK